MSFRRAPRRSHTRHGRDGRAGRVVFGSAGVLAVALAWLSLLARTGPTRAQAGPSRRPPHRDAATIHFDAAVDGSDGVLTDVADVDGATTLDLARECLRRADMQCVHRALAARAVGVPIDFCQHVFASLGGDAGIRENDESLTRCCLAHRHLAPEVCERMWMRRLERFRDDLFHPYREPVPQRNRRLEQIGRREGDARPVTGG